MKKSRLTELYYDDTYYDDAGETMLPINWVGIVTTPPGSTIKLEGSSMKSVLQYAIDGGCELPIMDFLNADRMKN